MPGYTLRELDCTHCGNSFTDMEGDLILPVPRLCDDCLKALWHLSKEELDRWQVNAENRALLISLQEKRSLAEILVERKLFRGEE
ncbi:MAG: hypothetical protein ACK2T7_07785 [Anaerolineales bacterium]